MRKFSVLLVLFCIGFGNAANAATEKPKLIVMLVIDQFRADFLTRFEKQFKPAKGAGGEVGGFKYLMTEGAYFPFGQYDILQSMTGPGHATVLTGAYPYQAGIPANDWYDSKTKQRMYCVEDQSYPTVGSSPSSPHVGTSPKNLVGTTVGDELKNAGYPSRVISLALKDRAAILMGGHRADLAIWFDPKNFVWVSSKYYLPDGKLPKWVTQANEDLARQKGQVLNWKAEGPGSGLSLDDGMMVENKYNKGMTKTLPHQIEIGSSHTGLSPFSIEMTETLAERAVREYKLGQGKATDILAVSFSAHDYVGHTYGPNSREMEEMTKAEDREIAKLLNYIRKQLPGGLKDVVVVLTGDHGIPPNPDWLKTRNIDAGRLNEENLGELVEAQLTEKYGKPGKDKKWVSFVVDLAFYLNQGVIQEKDLTDAEVQAEAKRTLLKTPGVAHVFTESEYHERKLPAGMHERQILKTYFPGRSGDVMIIPKPFYMGEGDTTTHMTGYSYDRTVPIVIAGPGVRKGKFGIKAEVVDIAPTLSFLLGTVAPSLSEGRVLHEVVGDR